LSAKKKERKLTEAEQRRLDAFNATCDELVAQGYKRVGLEVSITKANVVAVIAIVVLFAVLLPLLSMVHPEADLGISLIEIIIFFVAILVLTIIHELIHGLTWSRFCPNGFKDIEFGIMRDSFTPYCTCRTPLAKGAYITGALMPMVILGILPIVVAFVIGNALLLEIGICMTAAAAGDVLIVLKVLGYKAATDDMLLYDHPTEAGSVLFER